MHKVILDQDGPEWLSWRDDGVGGSEVGSVLGLNPWKSAEEVFLEKTKQVPPFMGNEATARGKAKEPIARELYERLYGWPMPPCCGQHDDYPFLRASFDGLRADGKLALEIKAPSVANQRKVLAGDVPDYYFAQMQHQMLISGASMVHFVSYCKSRVLTPAQTMHVIPYPADRDFQAYLITEVSAFWDRVQEYRAENPVQVKRRKRKSGLPLKGSPHLVGL